MKDIKPDAICLELDEYRLEMLLENDLVNKTEFSEELRQQVIREEDLIDELRITTIPILLGYGISLFDVLPKSLEFNHLKTEVFLNQIVQSRYERKK